MARRRAKFPKRHKNKKQLGAAISYIAQHYNKNDNSIDADKYTSIIEDDLKAYKEDLSTKTETQKDPPCADSKVTWYADATGSSVLNPILNEESANYTPNSTRSAFTYPGSKNNIKYQIVPIIGQLRKLANTDRHIEGFLGGAGSFVSFPLDFTKNSVAIEYKPNVAAAHKGFVKLNKNASSEIKICALSGIFANFSRYKTQAEYDAAIDDGKESGKPPGKAVVDSCEGYISTKVVQVNSISDKQDAAFRERYTDNDKKRMEMFKINHQERVYSRPDVKIVQGSFFDYLDGSLKGNEPKEIITPLHGDLIYMDPPYLGTEEQYGKSKKDCDTSDGVPKECKSSEFPKFEVPEDQDTCGLVPGDKKGSNDFKHRLLWENTANMYERMNNPKYKKQGRKGVHLAISHSAEGRFHCLIKNAFKKAISRGEFKACRVDVKRTSSKSRGFFDLPYKDELKEQEWLMIVSPQAKHIKCDEVPIQNINKEKDIKVRTEMINESCKRKECRTALGKKYLSEKIQGMQDDEAVKFLMEGSNNKCPPAKLPDWLQSRPGIRNRLDQIRSSKKCGKKYSVWGPDKRSDADLEDMESADVCD